jgi:hypothetical protein
LDRHLLIFDLAAEQAQATIQRLLQMGEASLRLEGGQGKVGMAATEQFPSIGEDVLNREICQPKEPGMRWR